MDQGAEIRSIVRNEETWGGWVNRVAISTSENVEEAIKNPYVETALFGVAVIGVGLAGRKILGAAEKLFPETSALLGGIDNTEASEVSKVVSERGNSILNGRGAELVPRDSFQPAAVADLERKYAELPGRSISNYTPGGDSYRWGETRASKSKETYPNVHLSELSNMLTDRFGAKTDLRLLELAPDVTTDVARTLAPNLKSYSAIDAQMVPLKDQRRFLEDLGVPEIFHARADLARLPFASKSHDLVVVSYNNVFVSGHPTEVELAVNEVARVLRADGELVVQPWNGTLQPNMVRSWAEADRQDTILSKFQIIDFRSIGDGDFAVALKKRSTTA